MKLYSQKDVDKKALKGARIAVLGYGSQGRAHALNLSDSGFDVVVGVRKGGASWKKAKKDGLAVAEPVEAAASADLVAMLVPDMAQKGVYESVEKSLKKGATLLFAHGFNIHYKQIKPRKDLDVVLIAPKGPGGLVRRQYQEGRGVPCLIAVAQDATGKAHAKALACECRARFEHFAQVTLVFMHRQRQHMDIRARSFNLLRRLRPAQLRQRNVHHGHVRTQFTGLFDGGVSVGSFADHFHIGLGSNQRFDTLTKQGMVIGEKNPNLCHVVSISLEFAGLPALVNPA